MTWPLFPDEYSGDQGRTDYKTLAPAAVCDAIKGGEGIGVYPSYAPMHAAAKAAGMTVIAYFWPLMREDPIAQARQFSTVVADGYAVDLEAGRAGTHSSNVGATKATVLAVMHAFFDEFHRIKSVPLLLYGASYMGDERITWTELVGSRDYIWAWLPRYSGGGNVQAFSRKALLDYAMANRYDVPRPKIAAVQFTDGILGLQPHTLPGLNRGEDLSALMVPIEMIIGGGDMPDDRFTKFLEALGSKDDPTKPATPEGAAQRLKAAEKGGAGVVPEHGHEPSKVKRP